MTKQTLFYALTILLLGATFVCVDTAWGQQNRFRGRGIGNNNNPIVKNDTPPAKDSVAPGERYALLIGVNNYDNEGNEKRAKEAKRSYFELRNLTYCNDDMEGLCEALVDSGFAERENITILTCKTDKKPTGEVIEQHINSLISKLKENDTIFVAFAGHGLALPNYKGDDKSELYLCPMDAEIICDPQSGKFNCDKLLSREKLEQKLLESNAGAKILVMDACRNLAVQTRSANLDIMEKSAIDEIQKVKDFDPAPVKGLFQLFSCDKGQTAAESDQLKHGIYSHFMIEGLKGEADKPSFGNNNGKITLAELQKYVNSMTVSHAKNVLSHTQAPKITTDGDSTPDDVILAFCKRRTVDRPVVSNGIADGANNAGSAASNVSSNNVVSNNVGVRNSGSGSGGSNSGSKRTR